MPDVYQHKVLGRNDLPAEEACPEKIPTPSAPLQSNAPLFLRATSNSRSFLDKAGEGRFEGVVILPVAEIARVADVLDVGGPVGLDVPNGVVQENREQYYSFLPLLVSQRRFDFVLNPVADDRYATPSGTCKKCR